MPQRVLRPRHQSGFAKLFVEFIRHVIHRPPTLFMRPTPQCRLPPPTHTGRPSNFGSSAISQLAKKESPSMCKMRLLWALIGNRHATPSSVSVHPELFTSASLRCPVGHWQSKLNNYFHFRHSSMNRTSASFWKTFILSQTAFGIGSEKNCAMSRRNPSYLTTSWSFIA